MSTTSREVSTHTHSKAKSEAAQSVKLASAPTNAGRSLRDRLQSPAFQQALANVLPKHLSAERMVQIALYTITRSPELAQCDQASFFRCLLELSRWGLEPDGRHAHLVPFRSSSRTVTECQLIIDYKGYVALAYRSGIVGSIHADVVREGDLFQYSHGQVLEHVPHFLRRDAEAPSEAGEPIAAYCTVSMRDGATQSAVLSFAEIEAVRGRSKSGKNGPWVTDWPEMAKKTAFRRVAKWLPLSSELTDCLRGDEQHEFPMGATPQRVPPMPVRLPGAAEDLSSMLEPSVDLVPDAAHA